MDWFCKLSTSSENIKKNVQTMVRSNKQFQHQSWSRGKKKPPNKPPKLGEEYTKE